MPSFWSAVANRPAEELALQLVRRGERQSAPRRMARLASAMASGALAAMVSATARTRGSSSAGSTTAFTRPMRSASVGVDDRAGVDQLARARHAHPPRQPLRPAEAGDDAQAHLGLAELGRATTRR